MKNRPSASAVPGEINCTAQDIIKICKCKHYRIGGIQAVLNYNKLKELLKELGLTEDQVKQCLHP